MNLPLQVTFRKVPPSARLTVHVREKASKLDTFFGRITGCRIAIEAPHTTSATAATTESAWI